MTTSSKIYVGDVGTVFEVTIVDGNGAVDVSSATTKQIKFKKPDDSVLTKDADFVTDGTDGKIQYTAQSGDLDLAGTWTLQAYIVLPTGSWHSTESTFTVYEHI